jgi:hypothetical protein
MSPGYGSAAVGLILSVLASGCASGEDIPSEAVRPSVSQADGASTIVGGSSGGITGVSTGSGGSLGSTGGFVGKTGGSYTGGARSTGGAASSTGGTPGTSGGTGGAVASSGGTPGTGGAVVGVDAGPPGTLLFSDDFESGPGKWATPLPGWSIVADGSKVFSQSAIENKLHVAAAGDVAWTDQVVEARVKVLSFGGSSTSYSAAVFARFKDESNHYYAALQSDGQFKIKKKAGGSNSSISTGAKGITVTPNTWYSVKLSVIGSTINLYIDGSPMPVLTTTDTDIAAGGIAVGTTNATAEFDDVKVTVP